MRHLSDALPRIAGQVFSRKYIMLGRLVTHWDDIVGSDLARQCQPVRVRRYKTGSDGKLAAALDIAASPANATLLHYRKDLILERINRIFGENWVAAIRFVPDSVANSEDGIRPRIRKREVALSPADEKYLSEALDGVGDAAIQERLRALGSAILQESRERGITSTLDNRKNS